MSIGVVCMIRIVIGTFPRSSSTRHHRRGGVTVHPHVAHGGGVRGGVAGGTGSIRLINHGLNDSSTCIDKPVINLKYRQSCVDRQLFLLILRRVRMGQMLEQPGAQDICRNFGKNAAFFAIFAFPGGVVVVTP